MLTLSVILNETICPFCQGTGVASYVDLKEVDKLPEGSYLFNDISKEGPCPDCIKDN